jgi:putative transposase
MPRRLVPINPGEHYHLYHRGVNRDIVFFADASYLYDLYTVQRYLLPVVDLVAYCLLPNHYQLLIFVKSTSEVAIIFCLPAWQRI